MKILIFCLFITQLSFAGVVLLAKGQSAIIDTRNFKNEFVGTKIFIANEAKVVAVGVITKVIKEDVKALVKITKGSVLVGDTAFTSLEAAYEWINDDGTTLVDELTPDFLKSDEEYSEETSEDELEDAPQEKIVKKNKNKNKEVDEVESKDSANSKFKISASALGGIGSNTDGIFYRLGGTVSFQKESAFYYLLSFDYSIVTYTADSISLGSGVSTFAKEVTYPYMLGGAGIGYQFGKLFVEGLGGLGYYSASYSLETNSASTVDFSASTLAYWYGFRAGYQLNFGNIFVRLLGGLNIISGTSQVSVANGGSVTESEAALSDTEYFGGLTLGYSY